MGLIVTATTLEDHAQSGTKVVVLLQEPDKTAQVIAERASFVDCGLLQLRKGRPVAHERVQRLTNQEGLAPDENHQFLNLIRRLQGLVVPLVQVRHLAHVEVFETDSVPYVEG